jgi:CubicO group peptidase (beta-lactamase class C family)
MATSPTDVRPGYGYLWWLNTEGAIPAAPKTAFTAQGNGGNYVYIDRDHDLVVVLRWTRDLNGVIARILGAVTDS